MIFQSFDFDCFVDQKRVILLPNASRLKPVIFIDGYITIDRLKSVSLVLRDCRIEQTITRFGHRLVDI